MTDATTTPTDKAGEPVAWRYQILGQWSVTNAAATAEMERSLGTDVQPLYTHPQPSLSVGLDREAVARVIADHIAGGFDAALQDKQEWIDRRGLGYDCEPLDVNGPFKDDYLDAADAILALAAPAEGWQGIETAPKDGTWIIGATPHGVTPLRWGVSWDNQHWANGCVVYQPTHWMPLPAAPTGGRS